MNASIKERELNRFRFLMLWAGVTVIVYLPVYILFKSGIFTSGKDFLILKAVVDLLYALLSLPIIVMRLKDLKWPLAISLIFVVASLLQTRNFVLLGMSLSQSIFVLVWVVNVTCLVIFLILLCKNGKHGANDTAQP